MPAIIDMLAFEGEWPRWSGRKDEAIRARFGIPPARYFQLLHRAIDTREALEADPMLVHRLRAARADSFREYVRRAS